MSEEIRAALEEAEGFEEQISEEVFAAEKMSSFYYQVALNICLLHYLPL